MTAEHRLLPTFGSAGRRRLAVAMTIFGISGLLLLGVGLTVVAAPVDAETGPFGIETQRRNLLRLLDASTDAIDTAEVAARDADDSLVSTADAAGSAGGFMTQLSTSLHQLAASLRLSILGSQPFAAPADDFDRVADSAASVAADLERAASSVRLAGEDMAALAADLAEMRTEMGTIRAALSQPIESDSWRFLLGGLLLWLAIPAAVSLWLGLSWLRRDRQLRVAKPR